MIIYQIRFPEMFLLLSYIYIKTHFRTNFLLSKQHEVRITQFYGIYDINRKFMQAKS